MTFLLNIRKMHLIRFLRGFNMFGGILIPFFTKWASLSMTQILLLQSWFMIWIFLLEVPTGVVADRFGRRYSLALACFVSAGGALVYVSSPNFYIFMIAEFLFALAAALYSGADYALIYDSLKQAHAQGRSKEIFGRYASLGLLAIMLSSPIGSALASIDLRYPLALYSVPAFTSGLICLSLREPKASVKESKRYIEVLRMGLKYFKRSKAVRLLTIDMVVVATCAYFIIWFFQVLLENVNVPIAYYGIVHAAFVLVEIAILNNFTRLERWLGSKQSFLFLSAALPGLMYILSALINDLIVVLFSILIIGGFGLTRHTLLLNYIQKHIPSAQRTTITSAANMFRSFAIAFINPFVGRLADYDFRITLILLGSALILFSVTFRLPKHLLKD